MDQELKHNLTQWGNKQSLDVQLLLLVIFGEAAITGCDESGPKIIRCEPAS